MLKIPGVYVDFKGDLTELKRDFRKAGALAKEAGTDISNGMKNAVLPDVVTKSFNYLYKDLTTINRVAAITGKDLKDLGVTLDKDLLKNVNMTDREFKKLQVRMLNTKAEKEAEWAIKSIGRAANLTTLEMAGLYRKVGANQMAMRTLKDGISSSLSTVGKFTAAFTAASLAVTGLVYAVGRVTDVIWDSGLAYARTVKSLEEISGGAEQAAEHIEYLRVVSAKYGQNLYDILPAYKSFMAATSQSGMSIEDTRTIYEGAIKAIATMGLTADDTGRVLYAFQQMVSKGMRGIAEEVNQQLGEVLPGAFGMFAKSIGVSEAKLRDMMEQGDLTLAHLVKYGEYMGGHFSGEVAEAVRASNSFNQAWEDLKIEMADSGFMESATGALKDVTEAFKDPEVKAGMKSMAENLGDLLEVMAKLSKYAGLRSIMGTVGQASNLSKNGNLGVPLDEFMKKGFIERQAIVDRALARLEVASKPKTITKPINDNIKKSPASTPLKEVGDKKKDSRFGMPMVQSPDYWGETYDIDYGSDPVAAAIQERELALNNEGIALRRNIDLQSRMAKAMDDTYDVDYGAATDALYDLGEKTEDTVSKMEDAFTGWASSYSSTLNDMVWESDFSFSKIAESFGRMVTDMIIQQELVKPFVDNMTGEGGWIKNGFSFLSGLFNAHGNAYGNSGVMAYAHGGAFTNSVVDRPTFFAHGGGFGVMGEAGPEAILPLTRIPGGDLGVKASSSSKPPNVKITINNNTDTKVEATQSNPKWNGEEWVLGVVLNAAASNKAGFRNNMQAMMR